MITHELRTAAGHTPALATLLRRAADRIEALEDVLAAGRYGDAPEIEPAEEVWRNG